MRLTWWVGLWLGVGAGMAARPVPKSQILVHQGMTLIRVLGSATAASRGVRPGPALAGDSTKLALGSGPRIHVLPEGSWIDLPGREPVSGLGVAWTGLVAVQGKVLGWLEGKNFNPMARLPDSGMRLVARRDGVGILLFGGQGGDSRSIYHVLGDGNYERLVEAYGAVTALAERDGDVVFAVGPEVFALPLAGQPILLYRHPEPVFSMATDPRTSLVFFSSLAGVFALMPKGPVPVLGGATGFLHHDGLRLYVSDPFRKEVLGVDRVAEVLLPGAHQAAAESGKAAVKAPKQASARPPPTPKPAKVDLPDSGGLDFEK